MEGRKQLFFARPACIKNRAFSHSYQKVSFPYPALLPGPKSACWTCKKQLFTHFRYERIFQICRQSCLILILKELGPWRSIHLYLTIQRKSKSYLVRCSIRSIISKWPLYQSRATSMAMQKIELVENTQHKTSRIFTSNVCGCGTALNSLAVFACSLFLSLLH